MTEAKDLYLDLMKRCLTYLIYGEVYLDRYDRAKPGELNLIHPQPSNLEMRTEGRDWPTIADTMIGLKRLDNLQFCVEDLLANNVPGDLIETGVWRGGASIFMRAILEAHGVKDKLVWVADSFQGLPPPNSDKYPADTGDMHHTVNFLAASLEEVKRNFSRYGLLDGQVHFLQGWFRDTLSTISNQQWAVVRVDGDMYESTMDALVNLYPNLSTGGYIIIDDYGAIPACHQAVHDYRDAHGIREEIRPIDWTGVYWKREQHTTKS